MCREQKDLLGEGTQLSPSPLLKEPSHFCYVRAWAPADLTGGWHTEGLSWPCLFAIGTQPLGE